MTGDDLRAAIAATSPLINPRLSEIDWDAVATRTLAHAQPALTPTQPVPSGLDELGNDKGGEYAAIRRVDVVLDEAVLSGALSPEERRSVRLVSARLATATVPAEPEPENPWLDRLVKAERENRCGDTSCMTRRTAAAIDALAARLNDTASEPDR